MLNFPKSTEFNRRIPKQKFYDKLSVTAELKRVFIEQINLIYWKNKISPATLNVGVGEAVTEIEIFEIKLKQASLDKRVLQLIDKEIPYHILHLLEHQGKYQAWIGYKEQNTLNAGSFKVNSYYHTEWLTPDKLHLKLDGLTTDAIYANFIKQVAGNRLAFQNAENIKAAIELDDRRQKLLKQVSALENKVNREKQFNIQVQLNAELKALQKELEGLS